MRAALKGVLDDVTMLEVFEGRGISLAIPYRADERAPGLGVQEDAQERRAGRPLPSGRRLHGDERRADLPLARRHRSILTRPAVPMQVFADGGLWANNPIMVGLVDALTVATPEQPIEIYSLGTCPRPEGDHLDAESAHRSMLDWSLGADVAPLSISAQEFAFDHMARLLTNAISSYGRSIRRVRFPQQARAGEHDAVPRARRHPARGDGPAGRSSPHRRRS